jgi:hypothetical protein
MLLPDLPNSAHSCSWHSLAAAWLPSAWPGSVTPIPKTSVLGVLPVAMKSLMLGLNFMCSIRKPPRGNFDTPLHSLVK